MTRFTKPQREFLCRIADAPDGLPTIGIMADDARSSRCRWLLAFAAAGYIELRRDRQIDGRGENDYRGQEPKRAFITDAGIAAIGPRDRDTEAAKLREQERLGYIRQAETFERAAALQRRTGTDSAYSEELARQYRALAVGMA